MKRLRPSYLVLAAGLVILAAGAAVLLVPWYQAAHWQQTPEAARAQRNAEAPVVVPIRPTSVARTDRLPARSAQQPTPTPVARVRPTISPTNVALEPTVGLAVDVVAVPTPTLGPSSLTLTASSFTFSDPPEPGARAQLVVTVHNPTDQDSGTIHVALPLDWLNGYRLDTMDPGPVAGVESDGALTLGFPGPNAGGDADVTFNFVSVDEVVDSPKFTVLDSDGRTIGSAHPQTHSPPARPGPIYSIDIPRLHLHAGVVQVDWEPPLFVVGQVRTSAWVTMGNSVLVGHVRGAPGYNVFDHLDQLEIGDEVIANSRGQPYSFVVTGTQVLPEDDTTPTDPTSSPRLTLMTCTGDWDPITQDYPDRLWVIAQPSWMVDPGSPTGPDDGRGERLHS